ncbi:hypothetical protein ID866_4958 [Astraeus odoratus]|nr:hypothetical protein ID866_4958 [Astraeus odoratus]
MTYPSKIQVIAISRTGGPEVLEKIEVPFPTVEPGHLVIKIQYIGVNFIDTYYRQGIYAPGAFPFVIGKEAAGVVVGLPSDPAVLNDPDYQKRGYEEGSKVAVDYLGAYAEYISIPWKSAFPVPDDVSTRAAAASALQGVTVVSFMEEAYNVQRGDIILIHTIAGGLGMLMCQYAKSLGATVIGTTSTKEKAELAKRNGADHVIIYKEEDTVARVLEITNGEGVHAIFDGVGKDTFEADLHMIRRKGTLVSVGNASGPVPPFPPLRLMDKNIKLVRPTMGNYAYTASEVLYYGNKLFGLVSNGVLKPLIYKEYPFTTEGVREAQTDLTSGKTVGKLVIKSMAFRFWSLLPNLNETRTSQDPWELRVNLKGSSSLNTLSDDILMEVFSYLDVEDILTLRVVSKLYYNLSHQGIIWKRFLKRIGPNAPQLPPSSRYSPRCLTSFEAERLVIRAITVHINWVSPTPSTLFRKSYLAHRLVQSMVVLPGGKYMVASVCNWAKNLYSLVVYSLDHRAGGIVPLAETPVKQKAYNLKAKYMTADGQPSIVIANCDVDPSIYTEIRNNPRLKIDPPVPFQYICSCIQIPLDSLDTLADPRLNPRSSEFFEFAMSQPPPFRLLSVMRSSSEFGTIDLAIIGGVPTLAVVKGSETVVFKQLTRSGAITTMNCAREEAHSSYVYHICNIRILPHQGEILVIRTITDMTPVETNDRGLPPVTPPCLLTLAMFAIPAAGDNETPSHLPISLVSFRADDAEDIQISDPYDYDLLGGKSAADPVVAPPINIFYRKSGGRLRFIAMKLMPFGLLHKGQPQRPYYSLEDDDHALLCEEYGWRSNTRLSVCAGSHRSLVYGTPHEDRTDTPGVHSIYSHLGDPNFMDNYSLRRYGLLQGVLRDQYEQRSQVLAKFYLCTDLYDDLRRGVKAMAWDESVGRIFYVKPDDSHIHVVDIAYAPSQTVDGQRCPVPLADERMLEL